MFILRRNRAIQPDKSPFVITPETLKFEYGTVSCVVLNTDTNINFKLTIDTLQHNTARVRLTELNPIHARYSVQDSLIKSPTQIR